MELLAKESERQEGSPFERTAKMRTIEAMIDPTVQERLIAALEALSVEKQHRVANYACSLSGETSMVRPPGTPVRDLRPLFGSVGAEYAEELTEAIAECQQVDPSQWPAAKPVEENDDSDKCNEG